MRKINRLNSTEVIKSINKALEPFFKGNDSTFFLHPYSVNTFRVSGNNISNAQNNYKNFKDEVKVIKWFANFWLFTEIKFVEHTTFISLSVFQGEHSNNEKKQLFRAEWDDYGNDDEYHPQPHWHIYVDNIENSVLEFADLTGDADTFMEILKEGKNSTINIGNFHFAMASDWINGNSHVHKIDNSEKLINWLRGLLVHLKHELEYLHS